MTAKLTRSVQTKLSQVNKLLQKINSLDFHHSSEQYKTKAVIEKALAHLQGELATIDHRLRFNSNALSDQASSKFSTATASVSAINTIVEHHLVPLSDNRLSTIDDTELRLLMETIQNIPQQVEINGENSALEQENTIVKRSGPAPNVERSSFNKWSMVFGSEEKD